MTQLQARMEGKKWPQQRRRRTLHDKTPRFADGRPTQDWPAEKLTDAAKHIWNNLAKIEMSRTEAYWWLGCTLRILRPKIWHGAWRAYLSDIGINKTRWVKARAIHKTFKELKDCLHLTVEEAYDRRERKQPQSSRPIRKSTPKRRSPRINKKPSAGAGITIEMVDDAEEASDKTMRGSVAQKLVGTKTRGESRVKLVSSEPVGDGGQSVDTDESVPVTAEEMDHLRKYVDVVGGWNRAQQVFEAGLKLAGELRPNDSA